MVHEWLWAGMNTSAIVSSERPPEYMRHGVHRQVHNGVVPWLPTCGGSIVVKGESGKAGAMVLGSHTDPCMHGRGRPIGGWMGDRKKGLRLVQGAAAKRVKIAGWDVIADQIQEDGLLQHIVDMGGAQVSWTNSFRQ